MTTQAPQLDERIRRFREDLAADLDLTTLIRKHITTGEPFSIDAPTYFELRHRVADGLELHPNSIAIVGSGRTGFSLKEKGNPKSRYHPFHAGSDIDVAIVSAPLFNSYWDAVFGLVRQNQSWTQAGGKIFARDLFFGWITVGSQLMWTPEAGFSQNHSPRAG